MTHQRSTQAALLLAMLLSLVATGIRADPSNRDERSQSPRTDNPRRDDSSRGGARSDSPRSSDAPRNSGRWNAPPPRIEAGYKFDNRYRHDRYYPPRGQLVDRLPSHPIVVPHRDTRYYFQGGAWYRPEGSHFMVVAPPIGLGITFLPPYYTSLWVGGTPYYYADEVYYSWHPERREYVVVEPPSESEAYVPPPAPEQLYVYPRQGQDEQLMAKDRYECHRWAAEQSGFDPVQPAAELSTAQLSMKRADYQRATKACLEAREYSVR